ncbi:MAG: hypothetical protein L0Y72_16200 [Gemmataceae bacterium]|nr:hypothetical protein [Gemmataceae bacterium]MCI0740590.1 hypothetical protein [Gemmataceae bacterium]
MRTVWTTLSVGLAFLLMPSIGNAQDAQLQKKINEAIDKGVAYLKKFDPGTKDMHRLGAIALIGWTLLESGCTPQEAKVKSNAEEVRRLAIDSHHTYSLALAVIFLDKLGDGGDVPLIDSMTLRLLAAQSKYGGWTYNTPLPNATEQARLKEVAAQMQAKRDKGETLRVGDRDLNVMNKEWERQWRMLNPGDLRLDVVVGDNSNTQFAMMALWVARRHGLPVQKGLATVEKRFRDTQADDGQWGYLPHFGVKLPPGVRLPGSETAPQMSCAGLLGIALGQGVKEKAKKLSEDPAAKNGLDYLEKHLNSLPNAPVGQKAYYFLFSLERMAVVYDLKKIGAHDWYVWGAHALVDNQNAEGAWSGEYAGYGSDTCFALLFLKRANVAEDLTNILQGIIRKKADDPPRKKGVP